MGTISENKLGGLALVVGPIVGLASWLIRPGGGLVGGTVDPANAKASIGVLMANADMANISLVLGPIGIVLLFAGLRHVVETVLKGGNGGALASLGVPMILMVTIGWVIGAALTNTIASGSAGAGAGALYASQLGIQLTVGIIGGIGFLLVTLAATTNDFFNKNFAYAATAAAAVALVCSILGANDLSQLQLMSQITGVSWVVLTIWSVTVGLAVMKKG